jgi:hypothetical protein
MGQRSEEYCRGPGAKAADLLVLGKECGDRLTADAGVNGCISGCGGRTTDTVEVTHAGLSC